MSAINLDAIRARERKASMGPWSKSGSSVMGVGHRAARDVNTSDAEFIASARQDIPDLLAEVTRLTAELADSQALVAHLTGRGGQRGAWDDAMRLRDESVAELAAANAVIAEVRAQVDACRAMVTEHLMPPAAEPTVDLIVRGLSGILDGNKTAPRVDDSSPGRWTAPDGVLRVEGNMSFETGVITVKGDNEVAK